MTEEVNGGSAAAEYVAHIAEVMAENERFLSENAKGTCEEVIELINDAIDEVACAVKRPEREKDYVERAMAFFTHHVLMPLSYAVYFDLLAGNVPACFMELRLILESLVKCYLADSQHPEVPFFQERLELLEQEIHQAELSTSKIMKELGEELGRANDFVALWGKLSQDWVHMKGFTDKLVNYVTQMSDMPPWALVIPMNYTLSDLSILEELRDRILQFRSLLATAMGKYRQEYNPDTG
ncbi:MAG: hypothetical protein H5T64_03520 [Chloroflexi bacterium]|nr:hypothetical protein [Chloroflexota bacterium]